MRHLASPSRAPSSAPPSGTTSATDWPSHTIPVSRTCHNSSGPAAKPHDRPDFCPSYSGPSQPSYLRWPSHQPEWGAAGVVKSRPTIARRFTAVCAPVLRGLGNFLPRNGCIERRPSSRRQRFRLIPNTIWVKLRKAADFSEVSRAAKEPLLGVGPFLKCVSTAPIRFCRVRECAQHNSSE